MRKFLVVCIPLFFAFGLMLFFVLKSDTRNTEEVELILNETTANLITWFNAGHIDSVGGLYMDNACLIPDDSQEITGRDAIQRYFSTLYFLGYRFIENTSKSRIVSDSIVVDRGIWSMQFGSNTKISGTYLSQWHLIDGNWFIENEMTNSDDLAFIVND